MADLTARITIAAIDRFGEPARKVIASSKQMQAAVAAAGKEVAGLDRNDSALRKFRSLKTGLVSTGAELNRASARTAELAKQVRGTEAPAAKLRKEFEASWRKTRDLSASHRQQREDLHYLREELRGAGVDTRRLGDAQRRITADIERATGKMNRLRDAAERVSRAQGRMERRMDQAAKLALVGSGMDRFAQGVLRPIGGSVDAMRQVERARGELMSLGLTRHEAGLIADRGRAMSKNVAGVTAPVFSGAAYDIQSGLSQLGVAGVADTTELAALTARATKADLPQMTQMFVAGHGMFRDALYTEATDREFAEVFGAMTAKAVEQFRTTGPEMQQAMKSMGAGLAQAGISLADQIAALGELQGGMTGAEAGTKMAALARGAAKAQEYFAGQGLGIRTLDASGNMLAPADLLEEVQSGLGDRYTTAVGSEIQKAFGSDEATDFFAALWGQQDALRAKAAGLDAAGAEGEGYVRGMQQRRDDNMDARLEVLQQRWTAVREEIGESLIPALELVTPAIEALAEGVGALADTGAGKVAFLAAAGLGLLAAGLSPVVTGIGSLLVAMQAWRLSMARLRADMTAAAVTGGGGSVAVPGSTGSRSLAEKARGLRGSLAEKARGLRSAGWRGLADRARQFGKTKGAYALRLLKGRAGLLGLGLGAVSIGGTLLNRELTRSEKAADVAEDAGGAAGAAAGAAVGAAIGSVVPVLGTAIGGIAGSLLGGWAGGAAGGAAGSLFRGAGATEFVESGEEPPGAATPTDLDGLTAALDRRRAEARESAPPPAAAGGDRTVNITNRITIERRADESGEDLPERILRALERRQALAGREALGDAY